MSVERDALDVFLHDEMTQSVGPEVLYLATQVAQELGDQAEAVLFYGSCLRTGDAAGLMDFYVLVKNANGYGDGRIARAAHRLIPPHVRYFKTSFKGKPIHAKVSMMTLARFEALAKKQSNDISIWARFAQPSALVFVRDEQAQHRVAQALRQAIMTAMQWAVYFGPQGGGSARTFWSALFRATYGAELRIEDQNRAEQIIELALTRYEGLFLPAVIAAGFEPVANRSGTVFTITIPAAQRRARRAKWLLCQMASKSINLARILKGAVTFEGRADYVSWKIERRTGIKLELTHWQRNHPLLAMPQIVAQLWRAGAFRKRR